MKKSIAAALFSLALQSVIMIPAFAAPPAATPDASNNPLTNLEGTGLSTRTVEQTRGDLPILIGKYIKILLSLVGIIFVVLMVYAGYNWMTSAGEEEKITTAKDTIRSAIIGLIIIISAYAITGFVVGSLVKAGQTNP
jgi:hypothetical protein